MPVFVDTNILFYAEDVREPVKREIARDHLTELWKTHDAVISTQVLQELYNTIAVKLGDIVKPTKARQIIEDYCSWHLVEIKAEMILDAVDLSRKKRISFWDSLIIVAAQSRRCDTLLTEDLTHGQRFGKLKVVNPFLE